jgi:RNA polymerase subunit RPABC4/transcription elongation factor Spt4/putative effector of murein hydrolase LrgA (UPF0299 family)
MSRFSEEVRIISPIAWVSALLVAILIFSCLFFVAIPHDPKLSKWPVAGAVAFSTWPSLLLFCVVAMAGYINADARRRGMRYVVWTLAALFLPNTIGIILYFILRDPVVAVCPKCGAQGRVNFTFCPQCGTQLTRACVVCKRAAEPGWSSCPYCGGGFVAGNAPTARQS